MSHIFDALQRSEAERPGADISSTPVATEMLERAERQAISRWDGVRAVKPSDALASLEHEARFRAEDGLPIVADPKVLSSDETGEIFHQCQTLNLSIPLKTGLPRLSKVTLQRPRLSDS
jgi:hypothetical protein